MEPYLLLLILIPSTAAFVDCRTACRTCREHKEPAEMLEVYCSMCEECKERRREKMMEKMKHALKEGPPVAQNPEIPHTSEPTTSNYPEVHFPDSPRHETNPELLQETNLSQIQKLDDPILNPSTEYDGCPVQSPCSDEEEVTTPGIKRLSYTSTTTTTTTTTTTKRPCPTIRPCRKPTTTPQIILPPSLPPPPPPPPPVPIIPPYPVNNCFMPNVQPNPCPGYSYIRQAGPMLMAPGMLPAPMPPGYMYQPYSQQQQKGYHGTQRGYNQVKRQESIERQESGLYTDRVPDEFTSGERTPSIVGLTGTPRIKQLNPAKKDFVYVYVGVPKNMKSRLSF